MTRTLTGLLIAMLAVFAPTEAFALISGGVGNNSVRDPGWPKGADTIFNYVGRAAWWEGPPFGGGEWHAECRGDARALNAVLADFARLDVKSKRLVVHDGIGYSFWLAPNREPDKMAGAKIDWVFMVWQSANWERLRKLPVDFNPTTPADNGPPSQIDVFTANIAWADVTVPAGIEVVDERLEAHGFAAADGTVIEGRVTNLLAGQPIAATMRLQRIEPQKAGGYVYPAVAESKADAQGHWVLKNVPAGWLRVIIEADGFVPRIAGYGHFDEQPRWKSFDSGLARSALVTGRVSDEAGKPLADVQVRLGDVEARAGGRYESPADYTVKTDADGKFRADQVPAGKAAIQLHKPGYCRPGLGLPITMPTNDIELQMIRSGRIRVTVDFSGTQRPPEYLVNIEPATGNAVGTFGGSGSIDQKNQITFENVPPGKYVLRGQPNPSSGGDFSTHITIDLKGGQAPELTLKALGGAAP